MAGAGVALKNGPQLTLTLTTDLAQVDLTSSRSDLFLSPSLFLVFVLRVPPSLNETYLCVRNKVCRLRFYGCN